MAWPRRCCSRCGCGCGPWSRSPPPRWFALAAATVFDLRHESGHRRHLGRLIEQIQDEGFSAFTDVVQRKISHNLDSFTTSTFRYLVVGGVAFVAYLLWWPPRHLVLLLRRVPELRAALVGFGVLAVLGYALNDAGVTVPGLMLGVLIATLVPSLVSQPAPPDPQTPRTTVSHPAAADLPLFG